MKKQFLLILAFLTFLLSTSLFAEETLCYTERVTDPASFNIYTGREDANNPIIWSHTIPQGILDRVVRVGLYIEAYDVDYPADDEHDRVYFNGYDLGLLEGINDTWITVEKTVPLEALQSGINNLQVIIDELGKDWKVTIKSSELRFYCESADPDFSLGIDPTNNDIFPGETSTFKLDIVSLNDFSNSVSLTASGLPSGMSASFNPDSVIPTANSQLLITTAADLAPGTYTLSVTGTSSEKVHSQEISITIKALPLEEDFSFAITPSNQTINQGESAYFELNIDAINGFSNQVEFSTLTLPQGLNTQFTPTFIQANGKSILKITSDSDILPGTYPLNIIATDGHISHQKNISLSIKSVADFSLDITPKTQTLFPGEKTTYIIDLNAINNFDKPIQLLINGLPREATAVFSHDPATIHTNSQLTISTTSNTPTGNFSIRIQGISGKITHTEFFHLNIIDPVLTEDFSLTASPSTLTLNQGDQASTVVNLQSINGFNHLVDLSIDGLPEFSSAYFSNDSVIPSGSSTLSINTSIELTPGNYPLTITGNGHDITHTFAINLIVKEDPFKGEITNHFSVAEAQAGDQLSLAIKFTNSSNKDLENFNVYTNISPHLEILSDDTGLTNSSIGGTTTWNIARLNAGDTGIINIRLLLKDDGFEGRIENISYLSHNILENPLSSNITSLTIEKVDIDLLKMVDKTQIKPLEELRYTLTIKNNSSFPINDVTIEDDLNQSLEFISQDSSLSFVNDGNKLTWNADLPAEGAIAITLIAKVKSSVLSGQTISNIFKLNSPELKDDFKSNSVSSLINAEPVILNKIKFTKRSENRQTEVGRIVRFRFTVSNLSNSVLIAPKIKDQLPQGFSYIAGSSILNGQRISDPLGKNTITWSLPNITPNQTLTLRFQTVIGADAKRGKNINRGFLYAMDNSGKYINLNASDFINVSTAGFVFYSAVEGTVYIDRDRDGFYSVTDTALEGIEVRLSSGEKMITNKQGEYIFNHLNPGEYGLGVNIITLPERYKLSTASPLVLSLFDGLTDQKDFGVIFQGEDEEETSRLKGIVFIDKNNNLQFDSDEPLLRDYTVILDENSIRKMTKGEFVFTHLEKGIHQITLKYGHKSVTKEIELKNQRHTLYFPIKFTGIEVVVGGQK